MFKQDRYTQILSILQTRKSVTVNYLVKQLYVSPATIRRDLAALAEQGVIKHYYGGATLIQDPSKAAPIELRNAENHNAKMQIGQKALSLISNGDSLFIDASSTCLCMVPGLAQFENLTVVTNSQRVLESLSETSIVTYSVGGKLLRNSMAFTGRIAEECLREMHFDKCFFSCQALSNEGIMTDGGEEENRIHRLLVHKRAKKIVLCDQSKLGHSCLFNVGSIELLDYIVSDDDIFSHITEPLDKAPILLQAE